MDIIHCFHIKCKHPAKYLCNCTIPETYSCKKHLKKHCELDEGTHSYEPIYFKTKQAILKMLYNENLKTLKLKQKSFTFFSKIINIVKNYYKDIVKELNFDLETTNNYYKKFLEVKKLSNSEDNEDLKLLRLHPDEAIKKLKKKIPSSLISFRNAELFCGLFNEAQKVFEWHIKDKSVNDLNSSLVITEKLLKEHDLNENKIDAKLAQLKTQYADSPETAYFNHSLEMYWKSLLYYKYNDSIKMKPNEDIAYNLLGVFNCNEKRYEEALKCFDDAIKINPNYSIYYSNKGNCLKSLSKIEEAIEYFNIAIKMDQNDVHAFEKLGIIFFDQKNYENAINYFNEAIRINPENTMYHSVMGLALYSLGKKDEAIEKFNESLRINPNNVDVNNMMGICFYEKSKYEDALIYFSKAFEINPNNTISITNKGNTLEELGRKNEAIKFFKNAVKLTPNDSYINFKLGSLYYRREKHEKALKYAEEAIKINPIIANYYTLKGTTLKVLNRKDEAVECLNYAIK